MEENLSQTPAPKEEKPDPVIPVEIAPGIYIHSTERKKGLVLLLAEEIKRRGGYSFERDYGDLCGEDRWKASIIYWICKRLGVPYAPSQHVARQKENKKKREAEAAARIAAMNPQSEPPTKTIHAGKKVVLTSDDHPAIKHPIAVTPGTEGRALKYIQLLVERGGYHWEGSRDLVKSLDPEGKFRPVWASTLATYARGCNLPVIISPHSQVKNRNRKRRNKRHTRRAVSVPQGSPRSQPTPMATTDNGRAERIRILEDKRIDLEIARLERQIAREKGQ
jgi:hypothetical protein